MLLAASDDEFSIRYINCNHTIFANATFQNDDCGSVCNLTLDEALQGSSTKRCIKPTSTKPYASSF